MWKLNKSLKSNLGDIPHLFKLGAVFLSSGNRSVIYLFLGFWTVIFVCRIDHWHSVSPDSVSGPEFEPDDEGSTLLIVPELRNVDVVSGV